MYTLSEVQYLNVKKEVTKDIDFQNDGRTPREIVVHDNPPNRHPSTDKTFRGDGTLEKLKVHNADRDVVKVENHEASEGIRETVDEQVLKGRPFDTPLSTLNRVADNGGWEGM
jgi:hypothetical protein